MNRLALILAIFAGLFQHAAADVTVTNGQTYLIGDTNTTLSGTTRTWNETGTLTRNNGNTIGNGAGIRISGGKRSQQRIGDTEWTLLDHERRGGNRLK